MTVRTPSATMMNTMPVTTAEVAAVTDRRRAAAALHAAEAAGEGDEDAEDRRLDEPHDEVGDA